MAAVSKRAFLEDLWWTGVRAVDGAVATTRALSQGTYEKPSRILAVGKAAEAMYLAAADHFQSNIPFLVVTKYGHIFSLSGENVIEAGHPTPDAHSLQAGHSILTFISEMGANERLLFLLSGGSSAIAELPDKELTLEDVVATNTALLSSGKAIGEINDERARASQIKGGKLLSHFKGAHVAVLAISDVKGDAIDTIGSGLGAGNLLDDAHYSCSIVASNAIARAAAAERAKAMGCRVHINEELLYSDVSVAAELIATTLKFGVSGVSIWGGEPTVVLPEVPGRGGRNQDLALRVAKLIQGMENTRVLVAGTDGTDGPTDAAGAYVDGSSWSGTTDGEGALARSDSGSWLERAGCLFKTGPTGTNVMDLVIAIKD